MPAGYVKAYVKRGRRSAIGADASSNTRPSGSPAHGAGELFRGHLAEFGLVTPQGIWRLRELHELAQNPVTDGLPEIAGQCAALIIDQIDALDEQIKRLERKITERHRANELCQKLQTIPSIGVITAATIVARKEPALRLSRCH